MDQTILLTCVAGGQTFRHGHVASPKNVVWLWRLFCVLVHLTTTHCPKNSGMAFAATIVLLGAAFFALVFIGACLARTVALACP